MTPLKNKKSGKTKTVLFTILLFGIVAGGYFCTTVLFENEKPQIILQNNSQFLGKTTDISLAINDQKSGLRSVRAFVLQGDKQVVLFEKSYPRVGYSGRIGPETDQINVTFQFDSSGLKDGEAEIVCLVKDYSLRGFLKGNMTEIRNSVVIDTLAPKIRLLHAERYIFPGGSGLVIYQLSENVKLHGAEIGSTFHGGHPIGDGRDDVYIAYLGLPYNISDIGSPEIVARDAADNESRVPFSPVLKKAKQQRDRINVGDNFLKEKIPEFEKHYPRMTGSMKDKYIFTNNIVRLENNQKIFDICQQPISERLWKDNFLRMAGASRAGYADHRTYFYKDKEIDKQVHLGMDIASTKRAEVKAANKGKVIFTGYLGIYGNMVILDHGQGVFSLYSHLSQIQVADDDIVEQGVILGLTGKSGMAGGDHLHFSMLVNGIFVTPKEWWDPNWIEVTIEDPLADSRFD